MTALLELLAAYYIGRPFELVSIIIGPLFTVVVSALTAHLFSMERRRRRRFKEFTP